MRAAGPRGHALREWGFAHRRETPTRMPARIAPGRRESHRPARTPRADDRDGGTRGVHLRHRAFSHRLPAFPRYASTEDYDSHDHAWSPGHPGLACRTPAVRRDAPGVGLRCTAGAYALGQLGRDGVSR